VQILIRRNNDSISIRISINDLNGIFLKIHIVGDEINERVELEGVGEYFDGVFVLDD